MLAAFRGPLYVRPMRIEVNGESYDIEPELSIAALLQRLELDDGPVAVERNHEIVPRAEHGTTSLQEGDRLEIVQFVGGG